MEPTTSQNRTSLDLQAEPTEAQVWQAKYEALVCRVESVQSVQAAEAVVSASASLAREHGWSFTQAFSYMMRALHGSRAVAPKHKRKRV